MKTRYRVLATAAVIALLTGLLTGTAGAGETTARPITAPPAVQVQPDGTVVFTAVKRGATSITPNAIIVCSAHPQLPEVRRPEIFATSYVICNHRVALISETITLVHYGNWWVTKLFESNPNEAFLAAEAGKNCLPDRYRTKLVTTVFFPIDYIPPSASRTDNSPDVRVLAC